MIIGSRQKIANIQEEPIISIGNEPIKKISKCKTLGVIIDDTLLWKDHISEINTKVSKGLGIMKRIKPFVTESVLQTIYKSLILPYSHTPILSQYKIYLLLLIIKITP